MVLLIAWVVILVIAIVGTRSWAKGIDNKMDVVNKKQIGAGIIGFAAAIVGTLLRLFAQDIAWPKEYSYSGPREDTIWAIQEGAYQDIGLAFLIFGLMVILVAIINWLWSSLSDRED